MAIKKQYDRPLTVQFTKEWFDRLQAVADHEEVNVSIAQVVRDAVATAVPAFELQLGILVEDDDDIVAEQIRQAQVAEAPEKKKEDRTVGLFGGPPRPE